MSDESKAPRASKKAPPAPGSGPLVARLFHRALALVTLIAWLSLGSQIGVLIGQRGLLPAEPFIASLRAQGTSFFDAPTLFLWITPTDAALTAGVAVGASLSLLALVGAAPRVSLALSGVLYLSYAVVCRTFLAFQWDNLLLECALLAAFLPRDRRAPLAHFCLRVLLFKLYFESGVAKWRSPLGDWQDGSAMTFYYETAPLPARLAWAAHALPAAWHHFESWFTLFFELAVPFAFFAGRRARLAALAIVTGFQVVDIATANYGFFCHLSLALHVMLLDDADLWRARAWLSSRSPLVRRALAWGRRVAARQTSALQGISTRLSLPSRPRKALGIAGACGYVFASAVDGAGLLTGSPDAAASLAPLRQAFAPLRAVNTYRLFTAITRERFEPEIQTFDGQTWAPRDLRYKPGATGRAPVYVAPHQPRVDFSLWFYGLSYQRGAPAYVNALLDRVCDDPEAVQPLFAGPLPASAKAARVVLYRYHFTTPAERAATGALWKREETGRGPAKTCRSAQGASGG